jgi:hypothetical protein
MVSFRLDNWAFGAAFARLPEAGESVCIAIARMVIHSADKDLLHEFI